MTSFELVFSLFGLLLGLALAEVLGGFGTAVQLRKKIHIGWLTPLLGALVALDITSFWIVAWRMRDLVPAIYVTLVGGLVIIGLYYLIARIAFPHDWDDWPDLDAYYFENRKWVLGGAMACNVLAMVALVALGAEPLQGTLTRWSMLLFIPAVIAAMFVKDKRANIALLALLVVQYPLVPTLNLMGVGR